MKNQGGRRSPPCARRNESEAAKRNRAAAIQRAGKAAFQQKPLLHAEGCRGVITPPRYRGISSMVKPSMMSPSLMSLNFSMVMPHS